MAKASQRRTKLHDWHVQAGARMTDFGGWDMPIQYAAGPREEHLAVRKAAGLFDIDHMGRFSVSGPAALDVLQGVQTWDASAIAPGSAHYSLLCTESGGIIDDIFLYRFEPSSGPTPAGRSAKSAAPAEWLIVVNASNRKKDLAWLKECSSLYNVEFKDSSADTCMVALQGPASRSILRSLCGADPAGIPFHSVRRLPVAGAPCIVCTTGYTGEPGYEIMIPAAQAVEVWGAILEAGSSCGILPCGLAARDSLRAEACLPLYGHEITGETDPFSAGLGKAAVRLDGHDFIGKLALRALSRVAGKKLVCFRMTEPSVPRQGYGILSGGRQIGAVTTGLFSPSTWGYVGMGYVEAELGAVGTKIGIAIRDSEKPAEIVERPFYRSPHWGRHAEAPAAPAPVQGQGWPKAGAGMDAKAPAPSPANPDMQSTDEQGGKHAV
jgi:aminomethyltransferase